MAKGPSLRQRLHLACDFLIAPLRGRSSARPIAAPRVDTSVVPVRVDLLHDPHGKPASGTLLRQGPQPSGVTAQPEWQFSQTVLLRKSGLSSTALVWSSVSITGVLLIWAIVAPLNETVAVQGKLQPVSSVKRIDAPVPGQVEAVLVSEGQRVSKGQALLRFNLQEARSSLKAALAVRTQLFNEIQVYRASLGEVDDRGLSLNQRRQLSSQQGEIEGRRKAAQQDQFKSQARLSGLLVTLATAENVANRYRELRDTGAVSEVQVLEAITKVQELKSQRSVEEREISRLQAVLSATQATPDIELRKRIEDNLTRIAELDRDISQARQRIQFGVLTAPSPGQVFDINVGPGSVVQAVQQEVSKPVMKIVPDDVLQAKVYLPNNIIGFVRVGQRADISLDTFPANDYGRIPATVKSIGSDALAAKDLGQGLADNAQGLYFPAILQLKRQSLQLENKAIPLQAGMSLTADITLRQRRYISILTGYFENQRLNLERLR